MEQVVTDYLKHLSVPVSKRYCKKRIASHPDYPSILAVVDSLQQFGISHTVARANKENPGELPLPVLLHLETGGGSLLPVYEPKDLDAAGDKLKHWSGVLLKVEPTGQIADKENTKALEEEKRTKIFTSILMLAAVGLVAILLSFSFSLMQLLLIVTALAGLITGYFLFAKELGISYRVVESFCNTGTGAGCGKVLRSEEGKLFGFITFSDLTLAYFAAQLAAIGLLVPLWAGSGLLTVLGWISFLALPMVVYSLWLQAYKIKEWCRLCLVVSGVLALQALIFGYLFYSGLMNPMGFALPEAVVTFLLFGLAGSSLLLLKQTVQQKNRAVQNEIAASRIKNSPDVFTSLLFTQKQVDTTPFEHDYLIGDPEAPVKFTMAVNLYCGPCKMELEQARQLLSMYPGKVNLSLRILKSGDDGKTSSLLLKNWLQYVRERSNGQAGVDGQMLIDAWYDVMDAETFTGIYDVNGKLPEPETAAYLDAHYNWVKSNGITKTPTTFMNGYELPAAYRIKDLFGLIPGLEDRFTDLQLNGNDKVNTNDARISEK